jgi:hypothetical protein
MKYIGILESFEYFYSLYVHYHIICKIYYSTKKVHTLTYINDYHFNLFVKYTCMLFYHTINSHHKH